MSHETIVFLGPTLSREEAATHLGALYCPPAEQGSVVRAVRSFSPGAIVLIDGAFAKVPAVRHKEILWALSRGIAVYGAASMGALRAAELAPFGMRGHGLIYRWYRATPLADDDEVAVAMSPPELGAQALSEALINMRLTFRRAARRGIISRAAHRALEEAARSTHFIQRTYPSVCARAQAIVPPRLRPEIDALAHWAAAHAVDQKRADAVSLLRHLAAREPTVTSEPAPAFRWTEAWARDLDAAGLGTGDFEGQSSLPS